MENFDIAGVYIDDEWSADIFIEPVVDETLAKKSIKALKEMNLDAVSNCAAEIVDKLMGADDYIHDMETIKAYDENTFEHCINVAITAVTMGIGLGYNYYRLKNLAVGSLMHDIGKQLVPVDIITKKGRLTDAEMQVVKEHPTYGYNILSKEINAYSSTREIVHQRHENWDGSGYPRGLKGEEIYELAKIIIEEPGKWLVFVDNKEYGRRLIKDIKEFLPEEDKTARPYVSFITSDYRNNFEMSKEVEEIVCYEKQDARVLIATSVLDNGINLKDEDLLNIAILTDTETEFIQMLGRKRKDNGKINLYLFSSSKEHFEKRRRNNDRRVKIAENNYTHVSKVVEQAFKMKCPMEQICIKEIMAIGTQHKYIVNGMINKSIQAED